jgi:hypothetical protein
MKDGVVEQIELQKIFLTGPATPYVEALLIKWTEKKYYYG